jgi:small subunit ribosomal protein S20
VANIKSQKKRNITNEKARVRNKAVRSEVKTAERRVYEAIESGDAEAATQAMRDAGRTYDKAVSKGVVSKNHAANHKSKLARAVDGMQA